MAASRPSSRELAFFGLQAIIPAVFAVSPAIFNLIEKPDGAMSSALHKLSDGTLVIISFTMLISLSQDLQQSVRPYQREKVANLELLLRIAAIVVLAVYAIYQSNSMHQADRAPLTALGENCVTPMTGVATGHASYGLSILAVVCFIYSFVLCAKVLSSLRQHFSDSS